MKRFAGQRSLWGAARSRRAYTLSEMVVVIVILGLLGAIAVPVYSGIRRSSLDQAAIHQARLINAARDSYALTVPSAAASWSAAAGDEAKLQLLVAENLLAGEPSDYLGMSGNYSVRLTGGVRARTILVCQGDPVEY